MRRLQTEQLQGFHGELISELVEIKSSREVLVYARGWLKRFPEHEDAPELVGKWLAGYASNEAVYLAAHYLRTVSDTETLGAIVRAAVEIPRRHRLLYRLIEARLEQDPASRAWRRLQPFEVSSKVTDKLVLRWLELNRSNSALCLDVSCVALFTDSVEVVEAVLLWTETEKNNIYVWMVLSHLLRGSSKAHHALRPRISQFVRAWVKEHTNDEYCGRVFADLITVVKLAEDIRDGKVWYQQHQSFDLAWCVLTGLLRAQQKADPYVVEQAKRVLRNLSPEERAPVLVGALVEAHPDAETIAFAKNICMKSNLAWLIAILLPIAPDSDLLAKANEVLPELRGSEIEDDLILALLQTDPTNTSVLKAAKRWMRKNGGHASAASIQSLLTASQAKTGSSNPAG